MPQPKIAHIKKPKKKKAKKAYIISKKCSCHVVCIWVLDRLSWRYHTCTEYIATHACELCMPPYVFASD